MDNFVKKKYILVSGALPISKLDKNKIYSSNYNDNFISANNGLVNFNDSFIVDYGFLKLNKNHISELKEEIILNLNLHKTHFYDYLKFFTGKKILMIEKKSDFSKKIKEFNDFKYQQIIMSNGNGYYVISD
jgi:hypothetical protein